jgi:hypothetical protein
MSTRPGTWFTISRGAEEVSGPLDTVEEVRARLTAYASERGDDEVQKLTVWEHSPGGSAAGARLVSDFWP